MELARQVATDAPEVIKLPGSWTWPLMLTIGCNTWWGSVDVPHVTGWESNTRGFRQPLLQNNIPGTKPVGVHYDRISLRRGEPPNVTGSPGFQFGDFKATGGVLCTLEMVDYPARYEHLTAT